MSADGTRRRPFQHRVTWLFATPPPAVPHERTTLDNGYPLGCAATVGSRVRFVYAVTVRTGR